LRAVDPLAGAGGDGDRSAIGDFAHNSPHR
jgi:hypothetical protein